MLKWLIFSEFGFQSVDGIFLSGINSQQECPEIRHREMQIPVLGKYIPNLPVKGEETIGTNLKHRKLHLNIRNNIFTVRVVRHWTRLCCEIGCGTFILNQNSTGNRPLEPPLPDPALGSGRNCTISRGTFILEVLWIKLWADTNQTSKWLFIFCQQTHQVQGAGVGIHGPHGLSLPPTTNTQQAPRSLN